MIFSRSPLTIDVTPLLDDQWTGIPVFTQRLIVALRRNGQVPGVVDEKEPGVPV